ncbi:MAG TPA: hypothetical protein VJR89_02290 [Polyangiales bacterium]|nr:hypothetical protein [Polyangiales bacterium]
MTSAFEVGGGVTPPLGIMLAPGPGKDAVPAAPLGLTGVVEPLLAGACAGVVEPVITLAPLPAAEVATVGGVTAAAPELPLEFAPGSALSLPPHAATPSNKSCVIHFKLTRKHMIFLHMPCPAYARTRPATTDNLADVQGVSRMTSLLTFVAPKSFSRLRQTLCFATVSVGICNGSGGTFARRCAPAAVVTSVAES